VAVISNWRSELERRSCMQCLAGGVPVLGVDTGIIRQMIQTEVNGELLSGNDPERLAHSIFELYENRDRRSMLSAGARRSARQWPSMHQQLLQMRAAFEQILTDGSAV
jgi:glycosyltransferase involved in cell wall biosynthesis